MLREEDGVFMCKPDPLSQIVELLLGIHLLLKWIRRPHHLPIPGRWGYSKAAAEPGAITRIYLCRPSKALTKFNYKKRTNKNKNAMSCKFVRL